MSQPANPFQQRMHLTDGGLETTLVFHRNIELRNFAAFELLNTGEGSDLLSDYFQPYLNLAKAHNTGFVLDTPTWRANADWGAKMDYSRDALTALNKRSVIWARNLAAPFVAAGMKVVVSGCIGPRGDGYITGERMNIEAAGAYHSDQVTAFAQAGVDVVTAATLTYSDEAAGIVQVAAQLAIPVVISFTVETDGRLPGGESLAEAIHNTDLATAGYATHYMINCAHPEHFMLEILAGGEWQQRVKGIRANASMKSHAELDASPILDEGDRALLADGYLRLCQRLPHLQVIGGCCGTDHTHLQTICDTLEPLGILHS